MSDSPLPQKDSNLPLILRRIVGGTSAPGSTARSIVWNYAGYIYQLAINFGSTAYIAREISVPEYGLLMFVISLSITLNMLDLGIGSVLVQAYVSAKFEGGIARLNELLSTTFAALSVLGALGAGVIIVISVLLPGPFNIPHQLLHEAAIIFVIAAFMVQAGISVVPVEQVYQAFQRYDRLNQVQFITATLYLVLTVVVLAAGWGVIALAVVQMFVAVLRPILLFAALPFTIPDVRMSFSRVHLKLLRPLFGVSKWAFVNSVCSYTADLLMWVIIGTFGSMQAAAMFGLANKLPKQVWMAMDRGASVFLPTMSQAAAERDEEKLRRTYIVVYKLVVGATLPFVLLGAVFAWPLIHVWAGEQYRGATTTLQWLLLAAIGHTILYPSFQLIYAQSLPKKMVAQNLTLLISSSVCMLILVPRYGAAGLAAGFAIPNLIISVGWLTPVACKLAHLSIRDLTRQVLDGLKLPLAVTAAGVLVLISLWTTLPAFWLLVGGVLCGCIYFAVWGKYTAIPLYQNREMLSASATALEE